MLDTDTKRSVDPGRVLVDGDDVTALPERALALLRRAKLGFVFQAFHVLPHLSVADNVAVPGRPDPARAQSVLAAVGLGGLGERLPQQRHG